MTITFRNDDSRIVSRGIEYIIEKLVMDVTITVDRRPLDMKLSSFMGIGVGDGKATGFPTGDAKVTVVAGPGMTPLASISLGDTLSTGPLEMRLDAPEQT